MDFDEYEYLEKTVDDSENRNGSSKKKESGEKREKSHRRREEEDEQEEVERRRRKHSRNEEENGERKRDERERSERRREREDRRRSDKDGEKEKGKDRDREKDRERRDRETDREKEKERERRSSSRSKRHDSRERERERERELREREREIAMRVGRRFKDKKESEPEADPERDQRTVFAYQMPLKATERDVYEFFSKAGKVRDVRVIMDRNSRRSKGVGIAIKKSMMRDDGNTLLSCLINSYSVVKSLLLERSDIPKEPRSAMSLMVFSPYNFKLNCMYVEFYDAMSVPMAITLSGQLLLGQPVMVKPSEAEKNLVQPTATSGGSSVTGPADRKLYVGNLHFNMTEQQLRQIFEPFGPVELVQLPLDLETGQCKGFGFVQFAQVEHAKAAVSLNGNLEIAGRVIKVSSVTEHVSAQDTGTAAADLDDDEGGGLTLNAQSRAMLMQKLDRTGTASGITGPLGAPGLNGLVPVQSGLAMPINGQAAAFPGQPLTSTTTQVVVGSPTECLMLQNLFDPATESDPEFFLDVKEDVEGECSKFGRVEHIYVDRNSAGHVYLRFENKEAAMDAQRAMHNRWFAQKLISAIFLQPYEYEAKCRDSA